MEASFGEPEHQEKGQWLESGPEELGLVRLRNCLDSSFQLVLRTLLPLLCGASRTIWPLGKATQP